MFDQIRATLRAARPSARRSSYLSWTDNAFSGCWTSTAKQSMPLVPTIKDSWKRPPATSSRNAGDVRVLRAPAVTSALGLARHLWDEPRPKREGDRARRLGLPSSDLDRSVAQHPV